MIDNPNNTASIAIAWTKGTAGANFSPKNGTTMVGIRKNSPKVETQWQECSFAKIVAVPAKGIIIHIPLCISVPFARYPLDMREITLFLTKLGSKGQSSSRKYCVRLNNSD